MFVKLFAILPLLAVCVGLHIYWNDVVQPPLVADTALHQMDHTEEASKDMRVIQHVQHAPDLLICAMFAVGVGGIFMGDIMRLCKSVAKTLA